MFSCNICVSDIQFSSGRSFMTHFTCLHSKLINSGKKLVCPLPDCFRSFNIYDSYRRHVIKHRIKSCNVSNTSGEIETPGPVDNVIELYCDISSTEECNIGDNNLVNATCDKPSLKFDSALTNAVISFSAGLYDKNGFNESQIQYIIDSHQQLLGGGFLPVLKERVAGTIPENNAQERAEICQMFDSCIQMFDGLHSQHMRLKALEESGAYVKPISFVIGPAEDMRTENGHPVNDTILLEGQYIPISDMLKGFLELPGVFKLVCSYVNELESDLGNPNLKMSNLIQGKLWQTKIKPKFKGMFVLPLSYGFDDYEPNKELGSHTGSHKLGAGYFKLPFIPPQYQAALENIFLSTIFHSGDRILGNKKCFRKLVAELLNLETVGITIVTPDGQFLVHFALVLAVGDNLGANGILGFVESFSANFFCRICKEKKINTISTVVLNPAKIRTPESYERDLAINDVTLTGIKTECVFNELKSYHCSENRHLDVMHDYDEGVTKYVMYAIILYFYRKRRCSIDYLNELIQGFYYGPNEEKNRPPPISKDDLLKNKHLKGTASETRCLARYFGLIFGHLVKEEDLPVWNVYFLLRKSIDILNAPILSAADAHYLGEVIREHHLAYMEVFQLPLQPKFHLALHYEEIIIDIGPPYAVSCYRFEAKHKEGKRVAPNSNNRINLPLTVAKRHQLKVASRFLCGRGLVPTFDYTYLARVSLYNIKQYSLFHSVVPPEHLADTAWDTVRSLQLNGVKYSIGSVVVTAMQAPNNPVFGEIHTIKITPDKNAYFVLKMFSTVRFDKHFFAYLVESDNSWSFVNQKELITFVATERRILSDRKWYVPFRFSLQCFLDNMML